MKHTKRRLLAIGVALYIVAMLASHAMASREEWDQMFRNGGALGRVTLRVVDDKGIPVEGAHVVTGFEGTPKFTSISGDTNKEGTIVCEGRSIAHMTLTIDKEGYYKTGKEHDFIRNAPSREEAIVSGKWMPWNPTVIITLKKIRNPVPMYVKDVRAENVPCDRPFGFDLQRGEPVVPPSRGAVADITFNIEVDPRYGRDTCTAGMSFTNEGDGILLLDRDPWSEFFFAYEAPEDGYQKGVDANSLEELQKLAQRENRQQYFVLRVRSKTDPSGVIRGTYAKMWTTVSVGKDRLGKCWLSFSYWYNPNGTRNLEYNPRQNLFEHLSGGSPPYP